jgi:DNA (cytosine-5)-methyltransferase 1
MGILGSVAMRAKKIRKMDPENYFIFGKKRVRTSMNRPIGIDLFAGAGGLSLGFEQAGFDVVAAVEIDPIHAAIHKFNFPNCKIIPSSITGLTGKEIRTIAGIGNRKIDVVFGGPPCQGFSMMGKRSLDDARNNLVLEFVRIVKELRPSYFIFENVKGLTIGKHKQFLDELIETFDKENYKIRTPWKVLNAANYGIPQDRQRLILIGSEKSMPLPEYPEPLTRIKGKKGENFQLPLAPSCRDALEDIPNAEEFEELLHSDSISTDRWGIPSEYARKLRSIDEDAWFFGYKRKSNPQLLTSSLRTNHETASRERFRQTLEGTVEPISRFFKLPADGISNTLRAGTDSARGAFTSPRPIHYKHPRCITVREMARLHGFPDWFRFHETKWHGARQIGNAVPPPLARVIGAKILEVLRVKILKPHVETELNDVSLLNMDMSRAAKYWKISIPIATRNRKGRVE